MRASGKRRSRLWESQMRIVAFLIMAPAFVEGFVTRTSSCGHAETVHAEHELGISLLALKGRRPWGLRMKGKACGISVGSAHSPALRRMALRGGAAEAVSNSTAQVQEGAPGPTGETEEDANNASNPHAAVGGNCPHGLPATAHCMDCEVMAFLQRAAGILQHAGGRMDSTMFARQWTLQYPDDPLTPEQVAKAVGGILKESGYFHVEETNDPEVKLFELIELSEDGAGLGDSPPTMCLPFELPPPEKDSFVDNARKWLAITGVGRHPAVGSGLMTHKELERAIELMEPQSGKKRHDEVQYTGKWGESLVGYWTLGPCDGSNGCLHRERINVGCRPHWTCCGSEEIQSVFCMQPPP